MKTRKRIFRAVAMLGLGICLIRWASGDNSSMIFWVGAVMAVIGVVLA